MVGKTELKLALFADDIAFFLAHPLRDVPTVLDHLNSFGLCSGLKVNATKSQLLFLSRGTDYSPTRSSELPVSIASKMVRYLGILIGRASES